MDDQQLDALLEDAARRWRVPADPPLDRIWEAIEAEAFPSRRRRADPGWSTVGIAAVAALLIGVLGGRHSVRAAAVPLHSVAAAPVSLPAAEDALPDHRTMGELLGRTAVLLAALPSDTANAAVDPQIVREGSRLLANTRQLLDSPMASDPRFRNLLQDLELVLVQVARIEPRHRSTDMQFIQTALDEHDIMPRLRSVAADLSLDDF